jgi:hypothetical protein
MFLYSLIVWALAALWLGGYLVHDPEMVVWGFACTALGAGFLGILYGSLGRMASVNLRTKEDHGKL